MTPIFHTNAVLWGALIFALPYQQQVGSWHGRQCLISF